jgi:hypothetical protein
VLWIAPQVVLELIHQLSEGTTSLRIPSMLPFTGHCGRISSSEIALRVHFNSLRLFYGGEEPTKGRAPCLFYVKEKDAITVQFFAVLGEKWLT